MRRDELLVIAARIFAKKGIASATVRNIAEEAGILSGSLYHHFTSKEEMVREVITRAFENFYDWTSRVVVTRASFAGSWGWGWVPATRRWG